MKDIINGLWKWLLWILAILVLGGVILTFRICVIDKDYGKTEQDMLAVDKANKNGKNGIDLSAIGQGIVDGAKTIGNATVQGYKADSDYTYNAYNFDETFLMYEGDKYEEAVQAVLERLIENSNDNFYARTSVTAVNFGNNVTINYEGNVKEYQNSIKKLQNSVTTGNYNISFKYGIIRSYVNEIVITKK